MGFKDLFHMSVTDHEFLLSQVSDLISPNERISGNKPILADERLVLTLRHHATGESFQSLQLPSSNVLGRSILHDEGML